ncbi:MAG: hypothetical protein R3B13_32270 [Polyangiaceae bacterium]
MIRDIPFQQILVGSYRLHEEGAERALELALRADSSGLWHSVRGARLAVSGDIHAESLASHSSVRGTVDLRKLSTRAGAYQLEFDADDGRRFELVLQRSSGRRAPLFALSRFLGRLSVRGREIGEAELRVDLRRTLRRWLVL